MIGRFYLFVCFFAALICSLTSEERKKKDLTQKPFPAGSCLQLRTELSGILKRAYVRPVSAL